MKGGFDKTAVYILNEVGLVRAVGFHQDGLDFYLDWLGWFSTLLWEVFLRVLLSHTKNQNLIRFDVI